MFAYTHHIFVYFISYYKILLLYVKSLLGPRKTGNSFTRTNCHRGLEMFCLSGPARQRFDLTFKNSSRTFHEVRGNFYSFRSPSRSKIIILLQQDRGLLGGVLSGSTPCFWAAERSDNVCLSSSLALLLGGDTSKGNESLPLDLGVTLFPCYPVC